MASVETVRPTIAVASKKQNDSPSKKAKPVVAKKAVKKSKAPKQSGRVSDDTKIVALKKSSDIKAAEGTFCYAQIVACLTSKTVGEAKAKLAKDPKNPTRDRRLEVAWVRDQGYIRVA